MSDREHRCELCNDGPQEYVLYVSKERAGVCGRCIPDGAERISGFAFRARKLGEVAANIIEAMDKRQKGGRG